MASETQDLDSVELVTSVGKLPKPKDVKVSPDDLVVDPLNFRFDGTNNELGLNTTSLDELAGQVLKDKQILRHILLNEEPNGQLNVLVGGRRTRVAKMLKADPSTPQDVVKNMDNIPAYVYKGLTDEQKLFLINDQDQKQFRFTELVKLIFLLFDKGLKWHEVAARIYRQYGQMTGKADIINDLDAIKSDKRAWEKRLKSWLRGAIDEVYGEAYRIGGPVPKILLTEAAEKDKLIITKKNAPKDFDKTKLHPGPVCRLMGNQKRLDVLREAKEVDVTAGSWDAFDGGPNLQAKLEEFRKEDEGNGSAPPPKSLSREKILEAAKTAKSRFADNLLKIAAGDTKDKDGKELSWKDSDVEVALFEAKRMKYLQNAGNFKDQAIKRALYMVFTVDDFDQFKSWLKDQLNPEVAAPAPTESEVKS